MKIKERDYYVPLLKKVKRIMKITTLFMLCAIFSISATTYAQNYKVTINKQNSTIIEVLKEIEKNSEFTFFFNDNRVNVNQPVSVMAKNATIQDVLDKVFRNTGYVYQIIDRQVLIKASASGKSGERAAVAQQSNKRTITGTVKDSNGEPIIGANIVQKGSTNGTITDVDGNFTITVPLGNATLAVSYIGYQGTEIAVGSKSSVAVILKEDTEMLDEVVVVGYGTQKKVNLTGSVSTIKADQITKRSVSQTSQALQGLAPGLYVNQDSGSPGSTVSFNIRGIGTLGSTSPLILIDGVEGAINNVNSNDIESISVLKDAASASIYGSRAANGVILITTKRANVDKLQINVRANVGFQSRTFVPKYLGAIDFMNLRNEAYTNEGKSAMYDEAYIKEYKANIGTDQYPDTDWNKEVFSQSGIQQIYGVTAMGGSKTARMLASLNFINQDGNMINTGFNRYGIRINTDLNPIEKLKISIDLNTNLTQRWEPGSGFWQILYQSNRTSPIYAAKYENGTRYADGNQGTNPLALASEDGGKNEYQYSDISANGKLIYEAIPGLKATLIFSPRFIYYNNKDYLKKMDLYSLDKAVTYYVPALTKLTRTFTHDMNLSTKAYLNYEKKFGNHYVSLLGGYEQIYFKDQWFSGYRDNFILPEYSELNAGDVTNQQSKGSGYEWALQSYFGRLNYNYKEKYLFEANLRYDGSSRFARGHRWGLFPSFSAGWRISEESFLKNIEWLSNLKFTGSWGKLGNQEIGTYPYLSTITFMSNVVDHQLVNSAAQTIYSNAEISWEKTAVTNIGMDFSLFKNSLFGTFEYYNKITFDILLSLPIPKTMGLSPSSQNAGKVRNRGWDLSLGYRGKVSGLNYSITAMLSDVKNKVLSLKGGGPFYGTGTITQEGDPINSLYAYICEGIFQSNEEVQQHAKQSGIVEAGDLKYKDVNGDNKIDASDRAIIGNTMPRYTYSLDLTADYKNFDLNILFQGVGKRDAMLIEDAVLPFYNGGKVQKIHLDRWTPENTNASFPRLTTTYTNNQEYSSFYMKSAAFLRLKNLQIGYSLPNLICKKTFMKSCRFYLSADNLFQISDFWEGWDPEMPYVSSGTSYPQTRVLSCGLDINF